MHLEMDLGSCLSFSYIDVSEAGCKMCYLWLKSFNAGNAGTIHMGRTGMVFPVGGADL